MKALFYGRVWGGSGSVMTNGCFSHEVESINNTAASRHISSASVYIVAWASLPRLRPGGVVELSGRARAEFGKQRSVARLFKVL